MTPKSYLKRIKASPAGAYANIPRRLIKAASLATTPALRIIPWLYRSREDTNLTYEITELSTRYLGHFISQATGASLTLVQDFILEILSDEELKEHVVNLTMTGPYRSYADPRCDLGRRIGWYALVRVLKPQVVVETGIDKGFGSVAICAALLRNGYGLYYGTDINPDAGYLIKGKYATIAKVLYGDSIASLKTFTQRIELFINDSDHSADYEMREYEAVAHQLSERAVVVSDNAHATTSLVDWSELQGRPFMFWREEPKRHWYSGGGIGLSLPANAP